MRRDKALNITADNSLNSVNRGVFFRVFLGLSGTCSFTLRIGDAFGMLVASYLYARICVLSHALDIVKSEMA